MDDKEYLRRVKKLNDKDNLILINRRQRKQFVNSLAIVGFIFYLVLRKTETIMNAVMEFKIFNNFAEITLYSITSFLVSLIYYFITFFIFILVFKLAFYLMYHTEIKKERLIINKLKNKS